MQKDQSLSSDDPSSIVAESGQRNAMIHGLQPIGCSTAGFLLPRATAIRSGHPGVQFLPSDFISRRRVGFEQEHTDSITVGKIDHFAGRAPGKYHAMLVLAVVIAVIRVVAKKVMAI